MTPDEVVSALVDGGEPCAIDPSMRVEVAQRLFLHGLLREQYAQPRAAAVRRGRPIWRAVAGLAAMVLAGLLGVWLLRGDALPSAEATVDRAMGVLEQSVDRHYIGRTFVGEQREPAAVGPFDWYVRADRWAVQGTGPAGGVHWLGGERDNVWWVTPGGRAVAVPSIIVNRVAKEIDPTLLYARLPDAVGQLRSGFELTTVGREDVGGRRAVRVRAVRRVKDGPLARVEFWAEEATGLVLRAELRFETGGLVRTHIVEFADAVAREDRWYTAAGHQR